MAATTLTALPSVIYAGDTLLLSISVGDYPADQGWSLTYEFRKKDGALISFTSTASGSSHAFTVDKDTTLVWTPGAYKGVSYATDGTQRFTVWSGNLTVNADLSTQVENYDTRTHAEKALEAINATLEGKASRDVLNTTIAGQSISRMTFRELLEAKAYYESIVRQEQVQANGGEGNQILVRFQTP